MRGKAFRARWNIIARGAMLLHARKTKTSGKSHAREKESRVHREIIFTRSSRIPDADIPLTDDVRGSQLTRARGVFRSRRDLEVILHEGMSRDVSLTRSILSPRKERNEKNANDRKICRPLLCGTRRRFLAATFLSLSTRARFSQRGGKRGERRAPRTRTLVSLKSLDRERRRRLLHGFWHLRAHPPSRAATARARALSPLASPSPARTSDALKFNKVSARAALIRQVLNTTNIDTTSDPSSSSRVRIDLAMSASPLTEIK